MKRFISLIAVLATLAVASFALAAPPVVRVAETALVAQNTFSDPAWLETGWAALVIEDAGSSCTITVQRAVEITGPTGTPATWVDLSPTITAAGQYNILVGAPGWYRFGVKTGNYGSGTVTGRLLQ